MSSTKDDKATSAQVDAITTKARMLYKGTASTVIDIVGNFPLLNAIGKGDKKLATELLMKAIDKKQSEIAAYKAANPKKSLEVAS